MKKTFLGLLCVFFIISNAKAQIITDLLGRKVNVPEKINKIICLGPGCLRLIVYLQAQHLVVGVEEIEKRKKKCTPYLIANPFLSKLPAIGPGGPAGINKKPYLEKILTLKPQVIFATAFQKNTADEIQNILNIPVIVLDYGSLTLKKFEKIYASLNLVGKILNKTKRAAEIQDFIQKTKKDLEQRTKQISLQNIAQTYIGCIGYRGPHGIESTDREYLPFSWVKVNNVAQQLTPTIGTHIFLDKEMLLALNPEIIFLDGGGFKIFQHDLRKKYPFYKSLKAFINKHVYLLFPYNYYSTNIDTALVDCYAIGKILYPNKFKDINIEQKANSIYRFFVGNEVYEELKKIYGPLGKQINIFSIKNK